jgi:hypothetical protein
MPNETTRPRIERLPDRYTSPAPLMIARARPDAQNTSRPGAHRASPASRHTHLAKPQCRSSFWRRSRGLLPAGLGLAGATGSIMTGLPTVGGSLVGLLLAMARRTALAPLLEPRGFCSGLACMNGAETLLLWSSSTCAKGKAFPAFGSPARPPALALRLGVPSTPAALGARATVGMGPLDPVAWPRRRQTAVPFGRRDPAALPPQIERPNISGTF